MTVSVLALITDVIREGKPVVGFGFNSNGRYAPSGLLHDRFIPRLKAADPKTLVDEAAKTWIRCESGTRSCVTRNLEDMAKDQWR